MKIYRVLQVHGDRQGAPDNQTDKDRNPVPTSTGKDNVVYKRSARDKGGKKVKCQSSAAPGPGGTSQGNKDRKQWNLIRADQWMETRGCRAERLVDLKPRKKSNMDAER